MREIKSITGLRVISIDEGASVGSVSQVVVDLAAGSLLGLIIGSGAGERGVTAQDIQTIGSDVVMISSRTVAKPLSELPELEKRKTSSVHLLPVFTDGGRRLGVVSSIFIDPLEKSVTRYEVSSGAIKDIADGLLILPVLPGTVHGQDAVIVPESSVKSGAREAGGLLARFSQWGDSARKQYQQVAEKTEKLVESGSETFKKEAAVVREKAKVVGDKAKELGEKASEKAKEVGEMAAEKAKEVGDKAKDAMSHAGDEEGKDAPVPADEALVPVAEDKPEEEQIVAVEKTAPAAEKPACGESACGCGCDAQE
jgi:uncharacterized protein YrrD